MDIATQPPNRVVVAHVVTGLQTGGLERVVANLIGALKGSCYNQLVICLETGGTFVKEVELCGAKVIVIGKTPGMRLSTIWQLARLFRAEDVKIVHTHNPAPFFHGILAALLAGVPVRIHTKHGRNYPNNPRRVLLSRAISWFADKIVPVSDDAADVALKIERVNPEKIYRIWNGVDVGLYNAGLAKDYEDQSATLLHSSRLPRIPVIGTVARLSPEKDQTTMLAAFRLVLDQIPNARLVFVGDGPCMAELQNETRRLKIGNNVDFLGQRSDIPAQLSSFTLFALSSLTEGVSMTILEAMACRLPVVATDVGGNREIIQPPKCGLTVPARNPAALASACLELLRDPVRCEKMGMAGRERVLEHFSLQGMALQYRTLYEKLLLKKSIKISSDINDKSYGI